MSHSVDIAIRRQVVLERLKAGYAADYAKTVDQIVREVVSLLHDVEYETLGDMPKREFNALVKQAVSVTGSLMLERNDKFSSEMDDLAESESKAELALLALLLADRNTRKPSDPAAYARGRRVEASGTLPRTRLADLRRSEMKQMDMVLGSARLDNSTIGEAVVKVRGTRRNNFRDSDYANPAKRRTSTISNSNAQHHSGSGREATWISNGVAQYVWVSVLDSRTSAICQGRSGLIFKVGEGPLPPAHENCRSSISLIVDGEEDAEQESYYDWIQKQPVGFQEKAMGKKFSKLLRKGGLSSQEFAKLRLDKNFEPITLVEAEKLAPEIFAKANVDI